MKKLFFDYKMTISFSEVVNLSHFTFKCIPKDSARQKVLKYGIELDPSVQIYSSTDSFGNKKIYGTIKKPHLFLDFHIWGEVQIEQVLYEEVVNENLLGCHKYPYGNNKAGRNIVNYLNEIKEDENFIYLKTEYEKAIFVMQKLHKDFNYKQGVTNINTSAEEAFEKKSGVCQDIAHIYISLLHLLNIPARYVTGLMIGEGESHAWVEFVWRGKWIGVDPTNNVLIDDNYVKISDGRDSSDCEINRGIMYGGGNQTQNIEVKVWKEDTL